MRVLSLFDGISCGRLALERAEIFPKEYFASEIDDFAIQVSQRNFPQTIQVGDVRNLSYQDFNSIDLLMGGSPCQGFSSAGMKTNFSHEQSSLFFHFVRLLKELRPKYFLLENVKMKKEWADFISSQLGVPFVAINSNRFSAQSRLRYYWTNIPILPLPFSLLKIKDIKEPSDCSDILEKYPDRTFLRIEPKISKNGIICLGGIIQDMNSLWRKNNKITSSSFHQGYRVYSEEGKSPTLVAKAGGLGRGSGLYMIDGKIRPLKVVEYERLQTLPDGYVGGSINLATQAIGNAWTVDVIVHILKSIRGHKNV
ncbi:MAG: DNA (cytosine-5-)-methyltransferase [Bacteroidales bacterium]